MEVNKENLIKILDQFNQVIINQQERIEVLEKGYLQLVKSFTPKLDNIQSKIEEIHTNNTSSAREEAHKKLIASTPALNGNAEKVNKNYPVLEEFLQVVPDKSKDFVSSIVNNNYPTMTLKQFDALDRLAKQIGFTGNLAQ